MTELSTAPLEPAPTPRRPFTGPWTLISLTAILGAILVAAAPALGAPVCGWAAVAVTAVFSLRLAIIDECTHTLPNRLTGALAAFGATHAVGISWWLHDLAPLGTAAATAGILAVAYAVLAFTGSSGFGDIKFAAALALAIAPYAGFLTLYLLPAAFIISAIRIMGRRLRGAEDRHPHGPSIAIAGIALMAGSLLAGPVFVLA